MSETKTALRYSDEELAEFQEIIAEKLHKAKEELSFLMDTATRKVDAGTDGTAGNNKGLDDSSDSAERENNIQLAARLQKFISQLENAQIRIKNKTYGVCVDTGKLIPKDRLRAVPHTMHTIEAKLAKK